MISSQIRRSTNQLSPFYRSEPRHIVTDQAMVAFDQTEHAFALSNSTTPSDQRTDSHDIDHTAVLYASGRKIHFQRNRCRIDESHRNQRGTKQGNTMLSRSFDQTAWYWQIAGHYDAGDVLSA